MHWRLLIRVGESINRTDWRKRILQHRLLRSLLRAGYPAVPSTGRRQESEGWQLSVDQRLCEFPFEASSLLHHGIQSRL